LSNQTKKISADVYFTGKVEAERGEAGGKPPIILLKRLSQLNVEVTKVFKVPGTADRYILRERERERRDCMIT